MTIIFFFPLLKKETKKSRPAESVSSDVHKTALHVLNSSASQSQTAQRVLRSVLLSLTKPFLRACVSGFAWWGFRLRMCIIIFGAVYVQKSFEIQERKRREVFKRFLRKQKIRQRSSLFFGSFFWVSKRNEHKELLCTFSHCGNELKKSMSFLRLASVALPKRSRPAETVFTDVQKTPLHVLNSPATQPQTAQRV